MATTILGTKAVGSKVKIKVNGTLRDFIVVHQGKPSSLYDESCNGTWLLMKDLYENRQWHSSNVNDYANSTIHIYLNSTFLNLFDANIRSQIKQVKIPYRPGPGYDKTVNNGANGLSTKIFLLSCTEIGFVHDRFAIEGAKLAYFQGCAEASADSKRGATLNGSAANWWPRSPYCESSFGPNDAVRVLSDGGWSIGRCSESWGIRPALILPSNLYVSDDGSVTTNTAPSTPSSITVPGSIMGGSTITVSWGASTDAESNLEGYILERSTDGGNSWSQVYQGGTRSTTNTVAFGTASVMFRVKAYDTEGLNSGWRTGSNITVVNNRAPSAPGSITVPAAVRGGATLPISWTRATDSDDNLSGYELERSVNGGTWTQVYKGSALTFTDTITAGWNTVAYRVRAYDTLNATSAYVASDARTVDNNAYPVISSDTAPGTDLGVKNEGFALAYKVTDADGDTVTVKEYLDNVRQRTYTATLGQSNTFQAVTAANYQKILNGAHTLKVVANDGKADSAPYTVTFTKKVTSASITLKEPLDADDAITVMVLNIVGALPVDAVLKVLVTNNAKDAAPVWEDATADIKSGANHVFENKAAANGFAFNFKLTVSRGGSDTGGYISSIGGAFE